MPPRGQVFQNAAGLRPPAACAPHDPSGSVAPPRTGTQWSGTVPQRREEADRRGDPPPSSITLRAGRRWESIGRQWAVRNGRRKSAFPSSGGLLVSKQIQIEVELIRQ